jgi:catechol 2,3-dioxygenase-like lactoylglutathione lyase family enzyme
MTTASKGPKPGNVDMKLEVAVIPVSDVDRAKRFYENLGWRLDADFVRPDKSRAVQFTPPGSPTSIHLGTARKRSHGSQWPITGNFPGLKDFWDQTGEPWCARVAFVAISMGCGGR